MSSPSDPEHADPALLLPDLASRSLRGSVIAASDEFFAEKENLIRPEAASPGCGCTGR
jgi:allantoicase